MEDPLGKRTVFALDLTTLQDGAVGKWHVLTETPVAVRANAAVGFNGKLWVLGGLDDNGDTTRRVDIYDPATDAWTSGPELPASGSLNGFGADPATVHGTLLVSQADGRVYRIRAGEDAWTHAGDLHERRFFHRLVSDGEELWRRIWPASERLPFNRYTARAAPTPAVDAERIVLFFGTGDLFATDHDGNRLWHRNLSADHGSFAGNHGVGGSVLLTDDHAVVLLARKTYSYLLAVDRATGETRWKADREPGVSWTTPTLSLDGREIVVSSNGSVEGYDAVTGQKLWWIPDVKSNTLQSPLITEELVIVSGSEQPANFAIRRGARGELGENDIVWRSESTGHFGSPVLAGDCIYWSNATGVAQCIDPATGKSHWQRRLSQPAWVTPIAAGERIWFFGEKGAVDVLSAGTRGGETLARSNVEVDEYLTGAAPAGDTLLLRSGKLLHAVREER